MNHFASFDPKFVPMLAKWAMTAEEYEHAFFAQRGDTTGLQIEPAESGGVYLTATNGWRIAQVHDPSGDCDRPLILSLGVDFVDACRPRTGPLAITVEGAPYHLKLPDWMQAQRVIVTWQERERRDDDFWLVMVCGGTVPPEHRVESGADREDGSIGIYSGSSNHPSWRDAHPKAPDAFRPLVPWQQILVPPVDPVPFTSLTVRAEFLADLLYLGEVCELTVDKRTQAIHARYQDAPNIKAAIMPMRGRTDEERARDIAAYEEQERSRDLATMRVTNSVA